MDRRLRHKVEGQLENEVNWTGLPDDTVLQILSFLNHIDRASFSSTCRAWRVLGESPCLWTSLDLRTYRFDSSTAAVLSSRCSNLQKLQFHGDESADNVISLKSRNLREIRGDHCGNLSDATICAIAAQHETLECLQLGPNFCEKISSGAIKTIAICCPNLRKLRLSCIKEINADAINSLSKHCPNLYDFGFLDCLNVDETALGNLVSMQFLSFSGTRIKWDLAPPLWTKYVI